MKLNEKVEVVLRPEDLVNDVEAKGKLLVKLTHSSLGLSIMRFIGTWTVSEMNGWYIQPESEVGSEVGLYFEPGR